MRKLLPCPCMTQLLHLSRKTCCTELIKTTCIHVWFFFFVTQVNIVTTRSNINSSHTKFSKSVHNSNYYAKFQNNFYNNQQFQNTHNRFRPQNKNNNNRKQPMVRIHVSMRNTCKITWSCIILDSLPISECMLMIQRCKTE